LTDEWLTFDVFGRQMTVVPGSDGWKAYWSGSDGKRRPADIEIPSGISADEIAIFLDDLFHEYATAEHSSVLRL